MSWNPVLNKFVEIKNEYKNKFGVITYDESTWFEYQKGMCNYSKAI